MARNRANYVSGAQWVTAQRFYGVLYRWSRVGGGCSSSAGGRLKHQRRALSIYNSRCQQLLDSSKDANNSSGQKPVSNWAGKGIPPRRDADSARASKAVKDTPVMVWATIDGKSRVIPTRADIELMRRQEAEAIAKRKEENKIEGWKMISGKSREIPVALRQPSGEKEDSSEVQETIKAQLQEPTAIPEVAQVKGSPAASKSRKVSKPIKSSKPRESNTSVSLRDLMRAVPHSVVVLTTTTKPFLDDELFHDDTGFLKTKHSVSTSDFRGMTLSSFTTVSLLPEPIISFNIKEPSQTLDSLRKSPHFLIHILHQNLTGVQIATEFTRGNGGGDQLGHVFNTHTGMARVTRSHTQPEISLPHLVRDSGIIRAIRCEVLSKNDRRASGGGSGFIKVGDHTIVLAKVHEVLGKGLKLVKEAKLAGLCYMHGDFVSVDPLVRPGAKKPFQHVKLSQNVSTRNVESDRPLQASDPFMLSPPVSAQDTALKVESQMQDAPREGEAQDARPVDAKSVKLGHVNDDIDSLIREDINLKAK